jgi:hypothetical protein
MVDQDFAVTNRDHRYGTSCHEAMLIYPAVKDVNDEEHVDEPGVWRWPNSVVNIID